MESAPLSRKRTVIAWIVQLLAVAILVMAGFSKLTSLPEAVTLFTTLGLEPRGRFALGSVELLTAALLLWPRTAAYGGLLSLGLMTGAIGTHLFKIGIVYNGDPSLFIMAVIVFLASGITASLRRTSLQS